MRISRDISRFLSDEDGAVTVDYVVLTGAVFGLGLMMIQAVGPAASDITKSAGDRYATPRITVVGAPDGGGGLTGDVSTSDGVTVDVTL